jgi:hypothetical protein
MGVRNAVHLSFIHPILLKALVLHDLTPNATNPKNERFIRNLGQSRTFRRAVMNELKGFYRQLPVDSMPQESYELGIDDSLRALGG